MSLTIVHTGAAVRVSWGKVFMSEVRALNFGGEGKVKVELEFSANCVNFRLYLIHVRIEIYGK